MDRLEVRFNCRLFKTEKKRVSKIIKLAKDDAGEKRYNDNSHFVRCAVMRLLREEEKCQEQSTK